MMLRCSADFELASWIAISSNADTTTFIQLTDTEASAILNQAMNNPITGTNL
jgi:hypothetical protein